MGMLYEYLSCTYRPNLKLLDDSSDIERYSTLRSNNERLCIELKTLKTRMNLMKRHSESQRIDLEAQLQELQDYIAVLEGRAGEDQLPPCDGREDMGR